jgi:hypothetical protein
MEAHFRIINDEQLMQSQPDYDYFSDPRGNVDPAVISEVIQEAETYTRAESQQPQEPKPPIRKRIGAAAIKGLEFVGRGSCGLEWYT